VIPALENIDWHGFLGRPQFQSPAPAVLASLAREPILITGAGGSIGSALALKLGASGAQLILLESSENNLFDLESDFSSSGRTAEFYLGSAGDRSLLDEIFADYRPRIVFHAAAFKHVPLLEEQPFAAIANNIFGTQTLVAAASTYNARVILLSTDKAVAPASVMGATKRVGEQIVLTSGGTVLRLGNILGSCGSVAEVFARQIAAGAPLTVTDPAARRYFLTIPEAVDLLVGAAGEANPSGLFIPDLRSSHYIADLARFMAHSLAPGRNIPIEFTRLRAGDKETEALSSAQETLHAADTNGLIRVDTPGLIANQLHDLLKELSGSCELRELTPALFIVRRLVPDYTPSRTVESMLSTPESRVHNA
jgi:FlaA1/EpsC-like NDP-sugar epimerase